MYDMYQYLAGIGLYHVPARNKCNKLQFNCRFPDVLQIKSFIWVLVPRSPIKYSRELLIVPFLERRGRVRSQVERLRRDRRRRAQPRRRRYKARRVVAPAFRSFFLPLISLLP